MFGLRLKKVLLIIIGSAIVAFGIVHFNMQNNLGEGGLAGITLLLYFIWGINPAISYFILNIPLFFIGWRFLGRVPFLYTIIGTISVSFFLSIFQIRPFPTYLQSDMTLAALFAGIFSGIGLGIIFRYGGTSGGVDIIARIFHKKAGWSMGKTIFTFDFIVIMTSIFMILELVEGMYTIVAVYISARVIDLIQEGAYSARGAIIISQHHEKISKTINTKLNRGVTVLTGKGSFTGHSQPVLYCVVGRNEIVRLKNLIESVDPHAFVSVLAVNEALGEGFTLDNEKKPIQ